MLAYLSRRDRLFVYAVAALLALDVVGTAAVLVLLAAP